MEEKTGGELQPGTVNVKLNYRGIMMRPRGRGKMKVHIPEGAGQGRMEACRGCESQEFLRVSTGKIKQ